MARAGRSLSQSLPVAALVLAVALCAAARRTCAIGVNWGTQLSHQLPASTVVRLLQDNGFDRVKLFDAEDTILGALKGSGIQVMVGIPNDLLADLAAAGKATDNWVAKNVSGHVRDGVDVRSVTHHCCCFSVHLTIITSASETHPPNFQNFSDKTVSNEKFIWTFKLKMGSKRFKIKLQHSTYTEDLFWVV